MSLGITAHVLSIVLGVGGKLLGASAAAQFTTAGVAVAWGPVVIFEQPATAANVAS